MIQFSSSPSPFFPSKFCCFHESACSLSWPRIKNNNNKKFLKGGFSLISTSVNKRKKKWIEKEKKKRNKQLNRISYANMWRVRDTWKKYDEGGKNKR